jgi:hypothetical protein
VQAWRLGLPPIWQSKRLRLGTSNWLASTQQIRSDSRCCNRCRVWVAGKAGVCLGAESDILSSARRLLCLCISGQQTDLWERVDFVARRSHLVAIHSIFGRLVCLFWRSLLARLRKIVSAPDTPPDTRHQTKGGQTRLSERRGQSVGTWAQSVGVTERGGQVSYCSTVRSRPQEGVL